MTGERGLTWEALRDIALELPGSELSTSYGTPAVKVRGELVARLREDDDTVVLRSSYDERAALAAADPATFPLLAHDAKTPMLVAVLATLEPGQARELVVESWRRAAPARLLAAYDGRDATRRPGSR